MLVLSRKEHQSVRIGQDIEVTVAAVRGGRVRLAISAPRHIRVYRAELGARSGPPEQEMGKINEELLVSPDEMLIRQNAPLGQS